MYIVHRNEDDGAASVDAARVSGHAAARALQLPAVHGAALAQVGSHHFFPTSG